MKKKCACCGNFTLEKDSLFDICDICGWENDEVQEEKPDFSGGSNNMSLNEYKEFYFCSTKGQKCHSEAVYPKDKDVYFIFGKESQGLPEPLLEKNYDKCIRIPMRGFVRSLNLSNAVAVVVYEALRQLDYPDLTDEGHLTGRGY